MATLAAKGVDFAASAQAVSIGRRATCAAPSSLFLRTTGLALVHGLGDPHNYYG